jgi:hypothetical protein
MPQVTSAIIEASNLGQRLPLQLLQQQRHTRRTTLFSQIISPQPLAPHFPASAAPPAPAVMKSTRLLLLLLLLASSVLFKVAAQTPSFHNTPQLP